MGERSQSWATENKFIAITDLDPLLQRDPTVIEWVETRNRLYDKYRREEEARTEMRRKVVGDLRLTSEHFNRMLVKPEKGRFVEESEVKTEGQEKQEEENIDQEKNCEIAVITLASEGEEEEQNKSKGGEKKRRRKLTKLKKKGITVLSDETNKTPIVVVDKREAETGQRNKGEKSKENMKTEKKIEERRKERGSERRCKKDVTYKPPQYSDVSDEEGQETHAKHPSTRAKFRKAYQKTVKEKRRSAEIETREGAAEKTDGRTERKSSTSENLIGNYSDGDETINYEEYLGENENTKVQSPVWSLDGEIEVSYSTEEAYEAAAQLMEDRTYDGILENEMKNNGDKNNNRSKTKENTTQTEVTEEINREIERPYIPPPEVTYAVDMSNPDVDPRAYVLLNHPQAEVEQKDEAPGILFIQVPEDEKNKPT